MSIIKWNPVGPLDLFGSFEPVFDELFNRSTRYVSREDALWSPRIDVLEKEKEYRIVAELPGMEKKDISLTVKDGVLTVSGEKKTEEKREGENYYCCERRFGRFERSFRIAGAMDEGKITASYADGVLTVTVPKTETPEPESAKIAIK